MKKTFKKVFKKIYIVANNLLFLLLMGFFAFSVFFLTGHVFGFLLVGSMNYGHIPLELTPGILKFNLLITGFCVAVFFISCGVKNR
jgi:hypothetical protein